MAATELGPWVPLSLEATVASFRGAPFRWWISGGHALELHLGRSWRDHEDMDVSVARRDVRSLRAVLDGWDIHVAAGRLTAWAGQDLRARLHENNLWCRHQPAEPWQLDVTISDGDDDAWTYRRDPRVRLPWEEAVLRTADGVPYLAPELQLLFKSKGHREMDDLDAAEAIPALEMERTALLRRLLPPDHAWHRLLATHP
jgi:hypothetical protein